MTIRVLVVDDSPFICRRVREILEADQDFSVVGVAYNGQEAVELAAALRPDVITMDVEMPVMDGITAVKKIMDSHPCPILMFSAMTYVGAKATLDALNAGAIDFLPKRLEDIDANRDVAKSQLRYRVRMVASQAKRLSAIRPPMPQPDLGKPRSGDAGGFPPLQKTAQAELGKIDLLVIAASTGGPVAIQRVLSQIPASCKIPVLLLQHMPKSFTKSFAERLNQLCQIKVKEAEEGDKLQAGTALLGPGGMQMQIRQGGGGPQIALRAKQDGEIYSPCIDITFNSLAEQFSGRILAVVLTGMGSDGREGGIRLKQRGAQVWAQDEASSTIYGMPGAIVDANIADKVYSLDEIANEFKKLN